MTLDNVTLIGESNINISNDTFSAESNYTNSTYENFTITENINFTDEQSYTSELPYSSILNKPTRAPSLSGNGTNNQEGVFKWLENHPLQMTIGLMIIGIGIIGIIRDIIRLKCCCSDNGSCM